MTAKGVFNFNSIKVQLEPPEVLRALYTRTFQFHKGTIRTAPCSGALHFFVDFNSIKVQLELAGFTVFNLPLHYFNSIKVQLERNHAGGRGISSRDFNSIKVQLEHVSRRREGRERTISIP